MFLYSNLIIFVVHRKRTTCALTCSLRSPQTYVPLHIIQFMFFKIDANECRLPIFPVIQPSFR
uniref:Uncharacterized protein n=1 Tax=Arundo donax TaxID=35708 RepID=A0A0A9GMZ9_ARUDO